MAAGLARQPSDVAAASGAAPFALSVERPKMLSALQECELLRAAAARKPAAQTNLRLANMLMSLDGYAEAVALLEDCVGTQPDFSALHALALARLALETAADTQLARTAARRAVEVAPGGAQRAAALATLGKAHARLGDDDAARLALEAALAEDPREKDACKRLIALHLRRETPEAALALCDRLLALGVGHSRVLAGRTLALVRLGRIDEARAAEGKARLSLRQTMTAPPGWASLAAFNAALAEELIHHPALRFDRYGAASTSTWRIDTPATGGSPLLPTLYDWMQALIAEFVEGLADVDHPWVRARPSRAVLHNWCVITDGVGHEEWHVHQFGWLSGVYYVAVPEVVAEGAGDGGCIGFGLPEDLVGEAAADFGVDVVRPQAGMAMLFPSHLYHRTFPHGIAERRVCLAFDVRPAREDAAD